MIRAVVGANWGDEGKGKLTDVFAAESDIVVRFQGGNNAGHTIINKYGKFALHMLPSGVFYSHTVNIIGNGVALNIDALIKELNDIIDKGVPKPAILVSDRAQIVLSYHILFDKLEEERLGKASFGSTKSGIAPFYSDKYAKIGFQISELFDEEWLSAKLDRVLPQKNTLLVHLYHHEPLKKEDILAELIHYREVIAPYVTDTVKYFQNAFDDKKSILLEGQLGALRDPDFGIYPYSTSSSTLAFYAPIGSGLPHTIDEVWAVTKAYSSCVGAGPFVSEIFDDTAHQLRIRGGDAGEYGATTGRPRRMGWFDVVATRYGCQIQGATHLVLTNLMYWAISIKSRSASHMRPTESAASISPISRAWNIPFRSWNMSTDGTAISRISAITTIFPRIANAMSSIWKNASARKSPWFPTDPSANRS